MLMRANELLGYPADARLLIINADDLGMSGPINQAIARALADGVVSSATLMAPCPAAAQAMAWLGAHPEVAFGVHLTVVCDQPGYRYGPLSPAAAVPSLIDRTGAFHVIDSMDEFLATAKVEELEIEFRAQIEAVLAAGLRPTHLDWHCLHSGGRRDIFAMTVGLAGEYGLAVRVAQPPLHENLQRQGFPTAEHDLLDSFTIDLADKPAHYARLLRALPAGLSEWAVHPGLGNAEARASDEGWQVRQSDLAFLISAEARELIRREGIILLDYRPLQAIWRAR